MAAFSVVDLYATEQRSASPSLSDGSKPILLMNLRATSVRALAGHPINQLMVVLLMSAGYIRVYCLNASPIGLIQILK